MKKILFSVVTIISLSTQSFCADISNNELISFTAQKYKVDYNAQTQENKDKLKTEYEQTLKLVNIISKDVKDNIDLKVAMNLTTLNVWSQEYMKKTNISDATLQEMYIKEEPKTIPSYKVSNILVNSEKTANEIITKLTSIKEKNKIFDEFKKEVAKSSKDFITNKNKGSIGWIEIDKLDKNIQEKIKDKKANDIFKAKVENIGWQIIYIEDFKAAKKVTFEESKELLTNLAKQQEMMKEIDNLLKR
jgi:parvulin-like peptidyl-prolyl isomerase